MKVLSTTKIAPRLLGHVREGRDVAHLHEGVRGRLDPEQGEVARRRVERAASVASWNANSTP